MKCYGNSPLVQNFNTWWRLLPLKSVFSDRHAWSVLGAVSMVWMAGLVEVSLEAAAPVEHTNRRGHFGIYCVFRWQQHLAGLGGTGYGPGIESSLYQLQSTRKQ